MARPATSKSIIADCARTFFLPMSLTWKNASGRTEVIAIGEVRIHAEKLRDRCIMTTFDPDTQEQDPSGMLRIIRELDGSTALDSSVITPGKIRIGDQARILDR